MERQVIAGLKLLIKIHPNTYMGKLAKFWHYGHKVTTRAFRVFVPSPVSELLKKNKIVF